MDAAGTASAATIIRNGHHSPRVARIVVTGMISTAIHTLVHHGQ